MTLRKAGVNLVDCDHRTPPAAEHGYPYIAIPQLKDGHLDLTDVRRISAADYAEWTKKLKPRAHDVIVVRRCNSGDSALIPPDLECAIGQNLVVLRSEGKHVHPRFLRWLVRGPEWWDQVGKYINVGAVFDSLRCRDIPNFELTVPPLAEQVAIAGVLDALDDRIALLRETNTTLEAIAQALFKSWFVDFDPVRAKSQGLAPAGMDEATATLFPDGFEESALGRIPAGWRAGALAECAWLNSLSWSTRTHPERVWYLDLANVKKNEVASMQDFAFEDAPSRARRALRDGDTIVGTVRPGNRSFAYIDDPIPGLTASTGFAVLSPKSPEFTAFAYLASTQDVSIEQLAHVADGGAYPAVRPETVSALPCVLPKAEVLQRFDATARPVLQKIASNQRQAQALSALRNTLLPRLISGQLRLPPVDEAVAEATHAD
jgi:type I restriction enzyme S subunit